MSGNGKCSVEKESRRKDREGEMGEGLRVYRKDLFNEMIFKLRFKAHS